MAFSPIRSQLMALDLTPSKILVNCDINGWMETNHKEQPQLQPRSLCRKGHRNFKKSQSV
jgi:hypothetical protein